MSENFEGSRNMMIKVRELLTVERIVGEPIREGGVTMIPVVSIRGAGGFGGGRGTSSDNESGYGEGGGFAISGRSVGMYVLKDGSLEWQPAIDYTRMFVVSCAAIVAISLLRWLRD